MRSVIVLGCAVMAALSSGCSLDLSGIAPTDAGGMDAAAPDAGGVDAAAPDAGGVDGGTPPPDSGPADAGAPDAGSPVDAGPPLVTPCETRAPVGCDVSHSEITGCERLYDGSELAPRCPTNGDLVRVSCRGDASASFCDTSAACTETPPDGCVQPFWIRFDLGSPQSVDQVRFIAGWWADRPDDYEIWYADSPSAVPEAGATLAFAGNGAAHPWNCVTDEPCTTEVPDGCCPDGRSAPQVTDQSSYTPSCDLGMYFAKLDIADFPEATARYWYFFVRTGRFDDRIYLNEIELRHGTRCR